MNVTLMRSQRGMAVIVMLLILIVGGSYFLVNKLSRARSDIDRDMKTSAALATAKEALIAYAVTYYEQFPGEFGFLPCPNMAGALSDGSSNGNCGAKNVSRVGRLPWRSLGIDAVRDGAGECLWYAVTGSYKHNLSVATKTDMLNEDTNGMFRVFDTNNTLLAGATPESRAVAVIIAPGVRGNLQNRNTLATGTEVCGGNYTASNYLEVLGGINNSDLALTADTVDDFVTAIDRSSASLTPTFNDRVAYITQADIWSAVKRRTDFNNKITGLLSAAAQCVANYGAAPARGYLPWAAPVDLGDYRLATAYDDDATGGGLKAGRLPNTINSSLGASANLMTACTGILAEHLTLWRHWKDHLFYAVGNEFKPGAGTRSCSNPSDQCLTVTGAAGKFAAVVMFSGSRLTTPAQTRNTANTSPPDTETKSALANYLEPPNETSFPNTGGIGTFGGPATATFNDTLYTISDAWAVAPGP